MTEEYLEPNAPVYDELWLRFNSPEEFKELFLQCPLTKDFIDWCVEQRVMVMYHDFLEGVK